MEKHVAKANRAIIIEWTEKYPYMVTVPRYPTLRPEDIEPTIGKTFARVPVDDEVTWMFRTELQLEHFKDLHKTYCASET